MTIGSRHIMRWPLERQGEERILEHVRRQYSRIPQRDKSLPPGAHAPGGKLYSVFVSGESLVQLVEGVCPGRMDGVRVGNHGLETVFGDLHDFVQGHADLSQVRALDSAPAISKKLIG